MPAKNNKTAILGPLPWIEPMLALTAPMPTRYQEYSWEFKFDGHRGLTYLHNGELRILSRRGNDYTKVVPELATIRRAFEGRSMILDGELVALNEEGRPAIELLQAKMGFRRARSTSVVTTMYVFDVLHLDGKSLLKETYTTRRSALEQLEFPSPRWTVPPAVVGRSGDDVLEVSRQLRLEGVIAKRLDSTYQPGKRTGAWVKIKNLQRRLVVVGGFVRDSPMKSLLGGYYIDGKLVFAGHVVGIDSWVPELWKTLKPLITPQRSFAGSEAIADAVWCLPKLVVEVEYLEVTSSGKLRHAIMCDVRRTADPETVEGPGPEH